MSNHSSKCNKPAEAQPVRPLQEDFMIQSLQNKKLHAVVRDSDLSSTILQTKEQDF